ncbi:MAG: type IV pilus secretin PilQ [Methylococcaceae bacterium]|nr:type IV pilus secretin PilQ [Methylococcaceae bacterium]
MCIKQERHLLKQQGLLLLGRLAMGLMLALMQITLAQADALALQAINAVTLSGDKLQIQLQMDGDAVMPQVFQTDNPARIALDFTNLSNGMNKKSVAINAGVASTINIIEAQGRTRLVVNLLQSVPYQTEVKGNLVLLTLAAKMAPSTGQQLTQAPVIAPTISRLLPKQGISTLDFKRGDKGEGRIIIGLANPNTVIDTKETGGKVVVNFLNTTLPPTLAKNLDVGDFATPVKAIETQQRGDNTVVTISPMNGNYEYSSFQAEGFLTLEFRPLTAEEKVAQEKEKFAYNGEKLSLNFQDIEIRSVLQILADFTKLNVVAADNVTGKVTLQMNDVPWDQALDLILKSKGLSKRRNGDVILVAPTADINKMEEDELAAKKVVEQLEILKTEYIQVNYAKAENFRSLILGTSTGALDGCNISRKGQGDARGDQQIQGSQLEKTKEGILSQGGQAGNDKSQPSESYRLLSMRGTAVVDGRTNTLIVKDTGEKIAEVRKLIELLDKPVRQVMIESRIAIAQDNFARTLGVRFGAAKAGSSGGGQSFGLGGGNGREAGQPIGGGTSSNVDGSMNVRDTLVDLGATALASGTPVGALGMTLARGADYVLNLELQALQDTGQGEVLSNPRVMTSDRCKAVIKQGIEIPYVSTSVSGNSITSTTIFRDAVLKLDVTPQITPSGSITMNLNITKDQQGQNTLGGPVISKREVDTTVTVNDGETVVLGGVFESEQKNDMSKIPFLADLPGIGFLFTKKYKQEDKRELLIFVTPKVVNTAVLPK